MGIKKGDFFKYEYSENHFLMCRVVSIDEDTNKATIVVAAENSNGQEKLECSIDKLKK